MVFIEGALVFGPFAFIAAHLHQRFGLPLSTVGALVMGFALGGLGFALGARLLVARLGEVRLVRVGALLMAAALLAIALAPRPGWALPACMLMGLGFYMMHNTCRPTPRRWRPSAAAPRWRRSPACFFLGQSAGVGLAGLVVDRHRHGWVIAAGALGLLAVAWRLQPGAGATGGTCRQRGLARDALHNTATDMAAPCNLIGVGQLRSELTLAARDRKVPATRCAAWTGPFRAHSCPGSGQPPARHPQIGQREQRVQLRRVLRQPR